MRNIIRLIQKYSNLLLFLLFQIIAFVLLFSWRNSYHHSAYLSSSNYLVGKVYDLNSEIHEYFHLEEINEELKAENAILKNRLYNKELIHEKELSGVDSLFLNQYKFIPAHVISSQFKQRENFIVINKGKDQGVYPNMGVVGIHGVIGYTLSSSSNYASVLPIHNPKFELVVRHKKSKSYGRLKWSENNDWTTAIIEDVTSNVVVNIGDYFETKGASGFFPMGILVGKVIKHEKTETVLNQGLSKSVRPRIGWDEEAAQELRAGAAGGV